MMRFEPQTWTAEQYLGRAESGRTLPLRLACSRPSDDAAASRDSAEFFAKFVGLPEILEQSLFAEMLGNVLARACRIMTGEPAFIEIDESFSELLRQVEIRIKPGVGVGSRSLGDGISPPTFGRMSQDQIQDAAQIYLFDLLVQNPDRRVDNPNCVVVARHLTAIDFESCFSFLYPIVGNSAHPWEVSRQGIASRHLFHRDLNAAGVEWTVLVRHLMATAFEVLENCEIWLPQAWRIWKGRIDDHFTLLREHEQELIFEVVRSLA
jgi:hypothetical protein